jgi:CubicO group peptidase (beta-lactamase class C family)
MVEEGAVSLDTRVETLLQDSINVPAYEGKKITLQHLATHTAGLPSVPANMSSDDPLNPYADYTVKQMYAFLNSYELSEAPGSSHAYSNLELGLLGHILEVQSGKSYEQLLKQYIADPLGMDDTVIEVLYSKNDRFASPYNYGAPVKHWDIPTLAGAGAIRSTSEDMAEYMMAQLGLRESNLALAITETHQPRFDTGSGLIDAIGLGWFHATKNDTIIWHNGGTGGFQSFAGFNKEKGTAVVVLSNGKESVVDIGFHLLDNRHQLKQMQATATVDSVSLEKYTGTYQHSSGTKYFVSREGNKLFVQLSGQGVNRVFPKLENRFFYKAVKAEIEFTNEDSGEFQQLTLYQGGQEIPAKRISDETGPPQRKAVDVNKEILKRYTGRYLLQSGLSITVTLDDGRLWAKADGQQQLPIFPESKTQFFYEIVDAQIEFIPNKDGDFNNIKLYQAGRVLEGKRIEE